MKRRLFSALLALCMCLAFIPATVFAAEGTNTYHTGDIAVINNMIDSNGLGLSKAPIDGTSVPDEWTDIVIWNDATPKRVKKLKLTGKSLTGTLDVSGLNSLKGLYCSRNELFGLNVNNLLALEDLYCRENQLTFLDVSHLPSLTYLDCSENQLPELNVNNLSALEDLFCTDNQLTSLDVSNLNSLKSLYCSDNQLSTLTIGELSVMQVLNCRDNQLTSLDFNHLTTLLVLNCSYNQLTGILDVSSLPALQGFSCAHNQLTGLALHVTAPYLYIKANYNYIKDESKVTGRTIGWDDETFAFYPQYRFVTYDSNGGTGEMAESRTTDWEAFELPACEFTAPSGKRFKTWAIGSVNGKQVNAGGSHTFEADTTVYAIWKNLPVQIAVFRTGNRTEYTVGETVALAARAELGTSPYRYQFYVVRSNGSKVILRDYAYSNVFNWQPVTADTYQVGVNVKDATGEVVNREETITVKPIVVVPFKIAVMRTGNWLSYKPGDRVALAARAEGGTTPYRYQFYATDSEGTEVILRNYAYSNIFNWRPVTADTYQIGVRVKDGTGQIVSQDQTVEVLDPQAAPLAVAVFRAGYREYYEPGETVALAARAEGGAVPYRYQFYAVNSAGTKIVLRDYAYSNIYRWTPEIPDIYQVCVSVKDGAGTVVEEQQKISVGID